MTASWWPPKVGSCLRHDTMHGGADMTVRRAEALLHVLSVFEHDGETRIVCAEWFPSRRRWNYEVFCAFDADVDRSWQPKIWPDGQARPERLP